MKIAHRTAIRVVAGVIGPLLLVGMVQVAAAASVSQTLEETRLAAEKCFIEIDPVARKNPEFAQAFQAWRKAVTKQRVRLGDIWTDETRLIAEAELPAASAGERNTVIDRLCESAFVARVVSSAAAPTAFGRWEGLQKFSGDAMPAAAKLRGLREKRRNYQPDLSPPHEHAIIVKYVEAETDTSLRRGAAKARVSALHARTGGRVVQTHEHDGAMAEVVALPKEQNLASALQMYLTSDDVEYAQPDYLYHAYQVPNDTYYSSLWGMPKISAPTAWDTRTSAASITVAVTDTGIDYLHPDLAANMWVNLSIGSLGVYDGQYGADFINNDPDPMDDHTGTYHGTHCAGTIGAVGNNGTGVAGVAWQVKLMAVKVLGATGSGSSSSFASGLDYARLKGASIVSASLGWYPGYRPADTYVDEALARLRSAGVLFVNAAGNYSNDNDVTPTFPASVGLPNMVIVGASDQGDQRSIWPSGNSSHWGRWSVDVFAPGTDIYSTRRSSQYAYLSGTSMATPHVAGLLALVKSQFPWESAPELADRVRFTVDPVSSLGSLCMSGGRLNAAAAFGARPKFSGGSGRCEVGTGNAIGIGGIWITGSATKRVAFRAWGPTFAAFGIPNPLPNPQITIFNSSGQAIGSNDDWGTLPQAIRDELAAHGVTPHHSLESAWVASLPPGGYTVHLSGVGGGTGIGMVEMYDIDGATTTRFSNTSVRGAVGTGSGITIAGMTVSGNKPRQVYIRGIGPSLASFGVPGTLQDPQIAIYDSSGSLVASNDDWRSFDGTSTALENRMTKWGFAPSDNREAGILLRLAPGSYTVHLYGKNGATGIGMIDTLEY